MSETINHLIDAFDEGYIAEEKLNYFKEKGKEIERLLNGYNQLFTKPERRRKEIETLYTYKLYILIHHK